MIIKRISNIISACLIAAYVAFLAIRWSSFPDELPTHFNAAGVADSYGSKASLLIEPIVMLGLFILLAVVECFPGIWNIPVHVTKANEAEVMGICYMLFGVLKISVILICAFSGFMCVFAGFPVWPTYLMIGVILVSLILSIVRLARYN